MNTLTTLTLAASDRQFVTVEVPKGLTAAEAQHRLATWEALKLCLQDYVVSDFEMGGTTIKANAHNGRLKRSTAALAAADRGTP